MEFGSDVQEVKKSQWKRPGWMARYVKYLCIFEPLLALLGLKVRNILHFVPNREKFKNGSMGASNPSSIIFHQPIRMEVEK